MSVATSAAAPIVKSPTPKQVEKQSDIPIGAAADVATDIHNEYFIGKVDLREMQPVKHLLDLGGFVAIVRGGAGTRREVGVPIKTHWNHDATSEGFSHHGPHVMVGIF